eukprot:COSAG05_NODE_2452_length_3047_cov_1.466418_3_plen_72_part_00
MPAPKNDNTKRFSQHTRAALPDQRYVSAAGHKLFGKRHTMRADIIGHFKPCMTDIYLHIDARMADYIRTHP